MSSNENFRTRLALNLMNVNLSPVQLRGVMDAFDLTMADYEITRKPMDIIPADGMRDAIQCYLASKAVASLSMGTIRQYNYKLMHFFDTVRKSYADITANDIRIYLFRFRHERNASDSYLDNIRITINSFFAWLVDNDYLAKNPCAKVDKIKYQQRRREPLSAEVLEDIRWNCRSVREKALVDFLYSTGCRVSECADILLEDINWHDHSVRIRHGKGDKERIVYFNDEAGVSLREYLRTRKGDSPALWISDRAPYNPIHAHALENIIRKVGQRIGVHVYPHKLRHTFATAGLRGGMALEQLQALLGHSKPETTLIYAKQDQTALRMEHRRIYA